MRSRRLKVVPPPVQLRVAIYARVSSDQQAERQTIDSQLSELQASARRNGHEVQDGILFIDNGQSGTTLIRPALERLRDMVALSAIDVIYVHAPDRLARWLIERDYQELKQEIGLGHDEGRSWRGFDHHASLCIAAYGFLVAERCLFPPQARVVRRWLRAPALPQGFRPRGAGPA